MMDVEERINVVGRLLGCPFSLAMQSNVFKHIGLQWTKGIK
jgi:hypothetical protein